MPLRARAVEGAGSNGIAMKGPIRSNITSEVSRVISQLNPGNIFGSHPATVFSGDEWRLDRQNPPDGHVNMSVQRNGISAPSTVATVFIPEKLNISPPSEGLDDSAHHARMRELERVARRGLEKSFASYQPVGSESKWTFTRFEVVGEFSA